MYSNKIQFIKSPSQIHNVKILIKRPKALYIGQAEEQRPRVREFCLKSRKNSYY